MDQPPQRQAIKRPGALLFDMDGTLTVPIFDFDAIRRDIGVPEKQPILETLAKMTPRERAAAEVILHRHEERAASQSSLNSGCDRLLEWVRSHRLKSALITRNRLVNVQTVLARHDLQFDVVISREDGQFKPHPQPLYTACKRLGVSHDEAWMIGDAVFDVRAGRAAGIKTVWISHRQPRDFAEEPWRTVNDLGELLTLLCGCVS